MKASYRLSAKKVGFVLIAISIALFLIFLSSTYELMRATDIECREICNHNQNVTCPHAGSIPLQSYLGFSVVFVLAGIGIFMILTSKKYKEELTEKQKKLEKRIEKLKKDERKICELIKESGGAVLQSELVERSDFSKAKVSRTLNKLEGKGLIEKKRHGMSNIVILKY